jgi:hypothetical protein
MYRGFTIFGFEVLMVVYKNLIKLLDCSLEISLQKCNTKFPLSYSVEHRLRVFENRVLKGIFGVKREIK